VGGEKTSYKGKGGDDEASQLMKGAVCGRGWSETGGEGGREGGRGGGTHTLMLFYADAGRDAHARSNVAVRSRDKMGVPSCKTCLCLCVYNKRVGLGLETSQQQQRSKCRHSSQASDGLKKQNPSHTTLTTLTHQQHTHRQYDNNKDTAAMLPLLSVIGMRRRQR